MVNSSSLSSQVWWACFIAASLLAQPGCSSPLSVSTSKSTNPGQSRSFPIVKRRPTRTGDELLEWANNHKSRLKGKYGLDTTASSSSGSSTDVAEKRAVGGAAMTNYQHDSTWYAAFDIGTPARSLNLVLDTGSSDIWVSAGNYTPASSSSFSNSSESFSIEYGSGAVNGYIATETFSIAGHTVSSQPFAVGTQVSSNLQDDTTAGICGLGFQALSSAKSEPIWQSAGESEFSFYLQRASNNVTTVSSGGPGGTNGPGGIGRRATASDTTYGGVFTLGGTNSSLYQGSINWSTVISKTYWLITLGGLSVSNSTVDIGTTNKAAIDTGTTLIGGPETTIAQLYSQIEGASAIAGADGYYKFPCSTSVETTMTFGDQKYSIDSSQFNVAQIDASGTYCMGAFFSVGSTSKSTLQWIVGDTFLSSVYSVFQNGNTARVGFASLASGLNNGGTSSTTVAKTQQASPATSNKAVTLTLALLLPIVIAVSCI